MVDLPVNIANTYPDASPGDTTHQNHHDQIHAAVNSLPALVARVQALEDAPPPEGGGGGLTPAKPEYVAGALRRWDFAVPWGGTPGESNFVRWAWDAGNGDLYGHDGEDPWVDLDEDGNLRVVRAGFYEVQVYAAYTKRVNTSNGEGPVGFSVATLGAIIVGIQLLMNNVAYDTSVDTNGIWADFLATPQRINSGYPVPGTGWCFFAAGQTIEYQIVVGDGVSLADGYVGIGIDLRPLAYG